MSKKEGISRRKYIYAGAGVVVVAAAAGTGYYVMRKPAVPKQIVFSYIEGALSAGYPKWSKEFTTRTGVEVIENRFSPPALLSKLMTDYAAQSGSNDAVLHHTSTLPLIMSKGYLEPLDEYIDRDYAEAEFDDISERMWFAKWPYPDGKTYGVPIHQGSPMTLGMNKSHLAEAGLPEEAPKTYEDMLEYSKAMNKPPDHYGSCSFAGAGGELHVVLMNMNQYMESYGGHLLEPAPDEKWRVTFNSPQGLGYIEFMKALGEYSPPGWQSLNLAEIPTQYSQGKLSMIWSFADWWVFALKQPTNPETVFDILPGGTAGPRHTVANWQIHIPVDSRNKDTAWDFLKFMTSKEVHLELVFEGSGAVRNSEFTNPEILKLRPFYVALGESVSKGYIVPMPMAIEWGQIQQEILGPLVQAALTGTEKPQDALDKAEEQTKKLLAENDHLAKD